MEVMMMSADDSGERVLRALGDNLPWLREHLPVVDPDMFAAGVKEGSSQPLLVLVDVANDRIIEHPIHPALLLDPSAMHSLATFLASRVVCAPFN